MNWLLLIFWLEPSGPVPTAPGPVGVFGHRAICELSGQAVVTALMAETGRLAVHQCVTGQPT